MKRTLALLGVASLWLLATAAPSIGADNGTVNATVSTPAPCMTLDQTGIDFGIAPFSPAGVNNELGAGVVVTNCAGAVVDETLWIDATDANSTSSSALWTLIAPLNWSNPICPNLNQFHLQAQTPGLTYSVGAGAFQALEPIPGAGSLPVDLTVRMPCEGSDGQGETMTFDINFLVTIP